MEIELDEAIELIEAKKKDQEKIIQTFEEGQAASIKRTVRVYI